MERMDLTVAEVRGLAALATANTGKPDLLRADSAELRASPFLAQEEITAPAVDPLAPATSLAAASIVSSISSVVLIFYVSLHLM